jgi:hypothetical protein
MGQMDGAVALDEIIYKILAVFFSTVFDGSRQRTRSKRVGDCTGC